MSLDDMDIHLKHKVVLVVDTSLVDLMQMVFPLK